MGQKVFLYSPPAALKYRQDLCRNSSIEHLLEAKMERKNIHPETHTTSQQTTTKSHGPNVTQGRLGTIFGIHLRRGHRPVSDIDYSTIAIPNK